MAALFLMLIAMSFWFFADVFGHELLAQIAILAILAMSLDLLVGYTGMVSLGHAAFFGAGAYATAGFATMVDMPMWAVIPMSMICASGLAFCIGIFAVRLVGVFFIMITLAAGEMLHAFAFRSRSFGGDDGRRGVARFNLETLNINLLDPTQFSLFTLVVAGLVYLLNRSLVESPAGRVLQGIQLNEPRMRALGCRLMHYKLAVFVIAGGLAGLAGSLTAQHNHFVSPELLTWTTSGEVLIIVIVGGIGSLVGPAAGAAVFVILSHYLSGITEYWMLFMGLFFIVVVLSGNEGIYGLLRHIKRTLENVKR